MAIEAHPSSYRRRNHSTQVKIKTVAKLHLIVRASLNAAPDAHDRNQGKCNAEDGRDNGDVTGSKLDKQIVDPSFVERVARGPLRLSDR